MPYLTVASGDLLTAAQWNTNVRDQTIASCTFATRPTSPVSGQHIYETDTLNRYYWNNTAWTLIPPTASPTFTGTPAAPTAAAGTNTTQLATMASQPYNTAWGKVGSVSRTSGDITLAGATTDISGMSITFTGVAGRQYKASWLVNGSKNASDRDGTSVTFCQSDNTVLAALQMVTMGSTNIGINFSGFHIFTSTGSATFKLRGMSFSGNLTVFSTSINPLNFIIEDIGPA